MESVGARATKSLFLTLWATLLGAFTLVLAGPSLKALRSYVGEEVYWLFGLLPVMIFLVCGLQAYALVFFAIVICVGIYADLEEQGHSYLVSGAVSLAITCGLAFGTAGLWLSHQESDWIAQLTTQVEGPIRQAFSLPSGDLPFEIRDVIVQMPSVVVMAVLFTLFLAAAFEHRALAIVGVVKKRSSFLEAFTVPTPMIWVFTLCLLVSYGGFGSTEVKLVGQNILNICLSLYFLQGVSVLVVFFKALKLSPFWQFLLFVFLVLQLFLLVTGVGLLDLWCNFRERIRLRRVGSESGISQSE